MKKITAINWFRKDLRLSDNPSLYEASNYQNVKNIFILDDINSGNYMYGSASKFWLHNSLQSLNNSLDNSVSNSVGISVICVEISVDISVI